MSFITKKLMPLKPILVAMIFMIAGCTAIPKVEVEAAECLLFPRFRTTTQPQFNMTTAERIKAIRECHKEAGTTWPSVILYEMVVDGQGNVVKIRIVKPYSHDDPDQFFSENFLRIVQGYRFRPDPLPGVYRTFYYPILLKSESEFLNWPGDL